MTGLPDHEGLTMDTPSHLATLEQLVRPLLPGLPADAPLTGDTDLRAHGLNSFRTIQLVLALEGALGVEFPDEFLGGNNFSTPDALWAALDSAALLPEGVR